MLDFYKLKPRADLFHLSHNGRMEDPEIRIIRNDRRYDDTLVSVLNAIHALRKTHMRSIPSVVRKFSQRLRSEQSQCWSDS